MHLLAHRNPKLAQSAISGQMSAYLNVIVTMSMLVKHIPGYPLDVTTATVGVTCGFWGSTGSFYLITTGKRLIKHLD